MMEADVAYHELVTRLRGRRVTAVRVFLFTLQIYLAPEDTDARDLEMWCEPSWHVCDGAGIVTGSGAIEGPSTFDDDAEVARASATIVRVSDAAKVLVGQTLETLDVDPVSHALVGHFSGGLVVATFLDDPDISSAWVLRDPHRDIAVRGTAHGIVMGSREHAA